MNMIQEFERGMALSRQADMIPYEIEELSILLVGVGGIGSNVAYMLASMGARNIIAVDPDEVQIENIYPGWFAWEDIGVAKVDAVAEKIAREFNWSSVTGYHDRFLPHHVRPYDVVIVSTDSLSSRRYAWETFGGEDFGLWIDARMGGTNAEVYAVRGDDQERKLLYNKRLQGDEIDLPCGMKATAALTKGMIPSLVAQAIYDHLHGKEPVYCSMYDLRSRRIIQASR